MTSSSDRLPPGLERAVLEALDESVVVTDAAESAPGPTILYVNPAFERLTGWSRSEVLGRNPRFLQGPETDPAVLEQLRSCLAAGNPFQGETFNYRKNGDRFRMAWRILPIRGAPGRITHFVGAQQDVTEDYERRRELETSEARFRSLTEDVLDISNVGLLILDHEHTVVWVNRSVESFFGLDRDALLGRPAAECVSEKLLPAIEDAKGFQRHLSRYEGRFECHLLPGDRRKERWLEHWSQPIRTGLYAGGRVEHFADVTERHSANEQLRIQTRELEHAARLTLAGQMAAAMVHELAQPLAAAVNFIEIARRELNNCPELHPRTSEALQDAQTATMRAGTLARHMLDFSRKQGSGAQQVDLRELIEIALRIKRPDARTHGIEIECTLPDRPVLVHADPIEIEQVLYNLVQNSIRALERGGPPPHGISITLRAEPGRAIVDVCDSGPGVDPSMRERLFDAFQTAGQADGLGIGLWICWNIMERVGGTIELADPEPGRTTFRMTLPIASNRDSLTR